MPDGPATGRPVVQVCGLLSKSKLRWKLEELDETLLMADGGDGAATAVSKTAEVMVPLSGTVAGGSGTRMVGWDMLDCLQGISF
jgi:hypothetical protein